MDKRPHKERFDAGLKTRREVLGAAYVDKTVAGTDDFNREFQELLNTYCWNDIWNRKGLPRKARSMLNLCMLTALGKRAQANRGQSGRFRACPALAPRAFRYGKRGLPARRFGV